MSTSQGYKVLKGEAMITTVEDKVSLVARKSGVRTPGEMRGEAKWHLHIKENKQEVREAIIPRWGFWWQTTQILTSWDMSPPAPRRGIIALPYRAACLLLCSAEFKKYAPCCWNEKRWQPGIACNQVRPEPVPRDLWWAEVAATWPCGEAVFKAHLPSGYSLRRWTHNCDSPRFSATKWPTPRSWHQPLSKLTNK